MVINITKLVIFYKDNTKIMAKLVPGGRGGKINQFEKGETGNPNGRPKKSFATINEEMKKAGYKPLKKRELIEAYSLIFNSDEEFLKKLAKDKNTPFALRLIIQELANPKTRSKALQDYRDYMFGKAKENVKVEQGIDLENPLAEKLSKLIKNETTNGKGNKNTGRK